MYELLTACTFAQTMRTLCGWPINASYALFELLEETAEEGHGIEFDPIAFDQEWMFAADLEEINENYDEKFDSVDALNDMTFAVEFCDGILFQAF
jgi:hypothetical protein